MVRWIAPNPRSASDWIGLFKIGAANEDYIEDWWQYTKGSVSGSLTFAAPEQEGQYEFRYLLNDGYADAARSQPITVSSN